MDSNTTGGSFTPPPPPPAGGGPVVEEIIYATQPPKDPMVILLLNLFLAGGVGYLMIGQKLKGIISIVVWVIIAFPTCFAGSFILGAVAAADGFMQAEALKAGHPIGPWTFFKDHK